MNTRNIVIHTSPKKITLPVKTNTETFRNVSEFFFMLLAWPSKVRVSLYLTSNALTFLKGLNYSKLNIKIVN